MIADRPSDWASLVRERRKDMHLSQADVAREMGVSRQWVSNFENGTATDVAQLAAVLELLAALDMTVDLFGEAQHSEAK